MLPKPNYSQELVLGLLFVVIAFAVSLILLSPLMLPRGIPFYGDETYYIPFTFDTILKFNLPSWIEGSGPSSNTLTIFFTLLLVGLSNLFGQESAVKTYIMLMVILSGFLPYLATKLLVKKWRLVEGSIRVEIVSYSSGFFCLLFFYNPSTLAAANTFSWNYSFFPLLLALFCIYLKDGKATYLLTFCLTSVLASPSPFWIYLVATAAVCYITVMGVTTTISYTKTKIYITRLAMLTFIALLFNSYWLVPIIASYFLGAGGFFQVYTSQSLISLDGLRFLSFWNTFDVTMLGERAHYFFWVHPQNYGPLSIVIPIFAAMSILVSRKNRYVLSMALMLTIGIFLTKGVNDPLGYVYYFGAAKFPYGLGALLRNPTKFVPLVTFSYSFLIGLFIAKVYDKMTLPKFNRRIPRIGFRYMATIAVAFLVLTPITYGTIQDLQGYTWLRYRPTYVPKAYDTVNSWLSKQEGHFKIVWLGSGAYLWKDGYGVTSFPEFSSLTPFVSSNYIWPSSLNETRKIGQLLSILGVKYVILHSDSVDFPVSEAYNLLMSQEDLRLIQTFEMEPIALTRDALLKIDYKLPSSVTDAGCKGQFWDGFNMRMAVVPSSEEVTLEKVWESKMAEYFASNQQLVSELEGAVYFNISIPLTFKGSGVNLYLNYYDGGFKSISPVYHLGSLTFDSSRIEYEQDSSIGNYFNATIIYQKVEPKKALIYVFENTNTVTPVYAESQSAYSGNTNPARLVEFDQISPVEWRVRADSSSPFILVFTEPYDRLWRAYVNGKEIESDEIYGLVNGFRIQDAGQLDIRIYYKVQDYFNLGYSVSAGTAIAVIVYVLFNKLKIQKALKHRGGLK